MKKTAGQVWLITAKEHQVVLPKKFWLEIFKIDKDHIPTDLEIKIAIYNKYAIEIAKELIDDLIEIKKL